MDDAEWAIPLPIVGDIPSVEPVFPLEPTPPSDARAKSARRLDGRSLSSQSSDFQPVPRLMKSKSSSSTPQLASQKSVLLRSSSSRSLLDSLPPKQNWNGSVCTVESVSTSASHVESPAKLTTGSDTFERRRRFSDAETDPWVAGNRGGGRNRYQKLLHRRLQTCLEPGPSAYNLVTDTRRHSTPSAERYPDPVTAPAASSSSVTEKTSMLLIENDEVEEVRTDLMWKLSAHFYDKQKEVAENVSRMERCASSARDMDTEGPRRKRRSSAAH